MIRRIALDLDGVLADWTTAAIRALGREPEKVYADWPPGVYDLAEAMGISTNMMWRAVHAGGADFWADLEPYPWMLELVELCRSVAPTTILTSPSREPCSLAGKKKWIQRHFGRDFSAYLIGPDKAACSFPGSVLIDDRERGCIEFAKRGGSAIIFPQIWNRVGPRADPVGYIATMLGSLVSRTE